LRKDEGRFDEPMRKLPMIKTRILPALLCVIASCVFAGSPTPTPTPKKPAQPLSKKVDLSEQPPFVGMTKAQALSRYGEPKKHSVTEEGENWIYILNAGEVIGKAFIPFNFHATPVRTGVLIFGPNGKVKKYTWDVPTG
jgi:hypothetical protein